MTEKEATYPIYRKYAGIPVWFKIVDAKNFIEIKQVGKQFTRHEVEAKQYPEMVFIQDMTSCLDGRWEVVSEVDYNSVAAHFSGR